MKNLPLGIQSFEKLRENDNIYVDKTARIYELVQSRNCNFLSRPRRFGKSLLLSTLKAYFQGQRDLFEGLAMERLEQEWRQYPVLHLDLNTGSYTSVEELDEVLRSHLREWEKRFGLPASNKSAGIRFKEILQQLGQAVVLIDEYDKPLISTLDKPELNGRFRAYLKSVYSVLKTCDANIRFALITGVSKFSHVSIFSDLNNLRDISLSPQFADLCGITDEELHTCFTEHIAAMATEQELTVEQCYDRMKAMYDGYHFASNMVDIYNPFSILYALVDMKFGNYWYKTGTPTFLINLMRQHKISPLTLADQSITTKDPLSVNEEYTDPAPIFYQTGYLTIKGYNKQRDTYRLGFPNKEVEQGFLKNLVPHYTTRSNDETDTFIDHVLDCLYDGHPEAFLQAMKAFLAGIPYDIIRNDEKYYQTVIFIIAKLLGLEPIAECRIADGRIDMLVTVPDYRYLLEFKVDQTPEAALAQINEREYLLPYTLDSRTAFRIGVNFSTEKRNIDGWKVESGEWRTESGERKTIK